MYIVYALTIDVIRITIQQLPWYLPRERYLQLTTHKRLTI